MRSALSPAEGSGWPTAGDERGACTFPWVRAYGEVVSGEDRGWRVGELASATGVTVRALHHYDRLGLLVPARSASGHRVYSERDVQRLYRIAALRGLGLRLREIASLLDDDEGELGAILRRHLQRAERDLQRQRVLRDRLAAIVAALEESGAVSSAGLMAIMEAMSVTVDVVEIARILGVSRQRAVALTSGSEGFPAVVARHGSRPLWARDQVVEWAAAHPHRGPAWRRPSNDAPELRDIWRLLGHTHDDLDYDWIGEEHLLLALLDDHCPGAAPAVLASMGLNAATVRAQIVDRYGDPPGDDNGATLRPSAGYVLQRARLKAVELRDECVSSEHVLLALLEAPPDTPALALLSSADIDPRSLTERILAATDDAPSDADADTTAAAPVSMDVHAADIARILGVDRRQIVALATAADFPAARVTAGPHRVWSRAQIERWATVNADLCQPRGTNSPPPGMPGRELQPIVDIAIAEAKALHHTAVLVEHLLLALMHPQCPGCVRAVLEACGVSLHDARRSYIESMGDPFEPPVSDDVDLPPETHATLEHAALIAADLEDQPAGAEHLLLALMSHWPRFSAALAPVSVAAVHEQLMAHTNGMLPTSCPAPTDPRAPVSPKRVARQPLELLDSPAGRDPRRRKPWGSGVFEISGKPWTPANGQYFIDRDGYPVLTCDGRPIHTLYDEHGRAILDEDGSTVLTPVEIPAGARVPLHPDAS